MSLWLGILPSKTFVLLTILQVSLRDLLLYAFPSCIGYCKCWMLQDVFLIQHFSKICKQKMVFPRSSKCCLWLENSCCPAPSGWPKPLCKEAQCNYFCQTISCPKLNQLNSISPCRQHMRRYFLLLIFRSCLLAKSFLLLNAVLNSSTFLCPPVWTSHHVSDWFCVVFPAAWCRQTVAWKSKQEPVFILFKDMCWPACATFPLLHLIEWWAMQTADIAVTGYMDQDCDWKQEFTFMSHSTGGFSAEQMFSFHRSQNSLAWCAVLEKIGRETRILCYLSSDC